MNMVSLLRESKDEKIIYFPERKICPGKYAPKFKYGTLISDLECFHYIIPSKSDPYD